MSKFFKGLGDLAAKSEIPKLKEERNVLEAEKIELEGKVREETARTLLTTPLLNQMRTSLNDNEKVCAELLLIFSARSFTPVTDPEAICLIQDEHLRHFNKLHIQMSITNKILQENIASLDSNRIVHMESRINELTVKIFKYNEKLQKLREK